MSTKTYRTSSGLISIRSGQEGPRHDPYSFNELTVFRKGRKVVYHSGLGIWMEVDGIIVPRNPKHDQKKQEAYLTRRFEREIGWDPVWVIAAIGRAEKHRARKLWRYARMTQADITASEKAAGWDPNP